MVGADEGQGSIPDRRGSFLLLSGTQIRFGENMWLGDKPIGIVYPHLYYRIVRRKDAMVAQVLSTTPLNVSFRRALVDLD